MRDDILHVAEAFLGWEAIKGIGEYVKSTIEAVASSNILAERVGFSAEAFQRLAYAAKFAHIDQDELAVSLGQLSKRLGEVAMTGEGPASNALRSSLRWDQRKRSTRFSRSWSGFSRLRNDQPLRWSYSGGLGRAW